jgi:citrate lyase subunit beta/citryl-CoA lyase
LIERRRTVRLRRSELSTPGSSERMIQKAASSGADLVFLDLEDAVAPPEKVAARRKVVEAIRELDWGLKTVGVRVNALDTEWGYDDLVEVVMGAGERLDVIILPKVKGAEDIRWVDRLLDQLERKAGRKKPVGLEVLIEEVEALINVEAIAFASRRLEALIFGPGDFSASQRIRHALAREYPGDPWHYARNRIVVAARAAGLDAVDGPYADFRNPEGYRTECLRAGYLGFDGKWAIHPSQIDIANEVFSPTAEEVEQARRVVAAYEEAQAAGLGAVAVDGRMVDAASVRIARNVLAKTELIERLRRNPPG